MSPARTLTRGALAAGLILAAAAAGFALRAVQGQGQGRGTVLTAPMHAAASVSRNDLAVPSRSGRPPLPDSLPAVAFRNRHGKLRLFSHWRGRPLLVNFWAPWCSPCRAEIPLLKQLSRSRPQGVEVIGVAVDGRAPVLRYARHAGIRYPLLIGLRAGMRAIRELGMVAAFPFSVFVDAHGHIVTVKVGRLRAAEARLILQQIGALDRGQIDLATARRQIDSGIAQLALRRAQPAPG